MVTLLEVMITSQVTITSQEVIVTSPINEQMVEAITRFPKSNFVFETSFAFCVTSLLHLLLPVWSLGPTTRKSPFSQQSIRVEKAGVTF